MKMKYYNVKFIAITAVWNHLEFIINYSMIGNSHFS